MSALRSLARAYANVKQSIPSDSGRCVEPFGVPVPTRYQAATPIATITRYGSAFEGGRLCALTIDNALLDQDIQIGDTIYVSGVDGFEGEHTLSIVPNSTTWSWVDYENTPNSTGTTLTHEDVGWCLYAPTAKGEIWMTAARVLSHPGLTQREGQGIYTYPDNPTATRNFPYHIATGVDVVSQRTLGSTISLQTRRHEEDRLITEIWLGGADRLSALSEMYHTFYRYWTTPLGVGEALGWEPRDFNSDRFLVTIEDVQLGSSDVSFNEVRRSISEARGAYLTEQLTLILRPVKVLVYPVPQIALSGR